MTLPWRWVGGILVLLAFTPIHNWLRDPLTGLAGAVTADIAAIANALIWGGTFLAGAVGIAMGRVRADRTEAWTTRISALLLRPHPITFAFAMAAVAGLATIVVTWAVFDFQPVLIDTIAQLTHARHIAAGQAVAPADTLGFFRMQQTVPAAGGWISQYPPMHVWLLALATRMGATWMLGPVMFAIAIFFMARAVNVLMPDRAAARFGIIVAAISPFMLSHAATYMSHTTTAAFIAIAIHAFARVWMSEDATADTPAFRSLAIAGIAVGAAFATRPLSGITVAAVFSAALLMQKHESLGRRVLRVAVIGAGALPMILLVMWYNARYFGSPVRFGYDVALGPAAGLGFGVDPWGNLYGLRQAVAYTSAELVALSLQLFEAPIPLVTLIGLYLLVTPALARGERLLLALTFTPLAVNLLYWHHGLFMGPRMLNEHGILWAVTAMIALASITRLVPASLPGALQRYSPRSFLFGAYATACLAGILLTQQRFAGYSSVPSKAYATASAAGEGTLVFIHGGWGERLSMRLAARGWRLDQVEAALRQNSTCAVQRMFDGELAADSIDLKPRAINLPTRMESPAGNPMRVVEGEPWTAGCARQVRADTAGVIDPSGLLARSAIPGFMSGAPLFARDLGPEINASLRSQHPQARVLLRDAGGSPVLMPYDDAMQLLWGTRP